MRLGAFNQLIPPETSRQNMTYTLHLRWFSQPQPNMPQHHVITYGNSETHIMCHHLWRLALPRTTADEAQKWELPQ